MKKIFPILFFFHCLFSYGNLTLSGKITDKFTGEELVGVNVYVIEKKTGVTTNEQGIYSLNIGKGSYEIVFSYLGYTSQTKKIDIQENKRLNIQLSSKETLLNDIEISGRKSDANVTDLSMSVQKIPMLTIKKMPSLMGEADILKSIQLLPGVQAAAEGTSGFSVRGGSMDQNLILLEESTVYNASHLMGFFSVFNNDAIEDATLYKGDIPAIYGGRLSSVLDVSMKDGNEKKWKGSGGIGLISSRLALEGPIVKNKSSFLISGRRTYADIFLPLSPNKEIRDNTLYFYDLTAKLNYKIDEKNRIYTSGYWGRDKFGTKVAGMDFGNGIGNIRWNHIFSKTFFSNVSLISSQYNYDLNLKLGDEVGFEWKAGLLDFCLKTDFVKLLNANNTLRFGINSTHHTFKPGEIRNTGKTSIISNILLEKKQALEHAFYISNEQKIGKKISVKYGIRASAFQNMGKETVYNYDEDFNRIDSVEYKKGEIYHTYSGIEPRLGLVWLLPFQSSIKASYSSTVQYIQLGSNSTGGLPVELWFPANKNIKPQRSNQYAIGWFKNFFENKIEGSVETYYKTIHNLIDFKDNAYLIGNSTIETEIKTGVGRSYGVEFLLRKNTGDFTGWIAYTYSRSLRTIESVSLGKEYQSPFDRPHNFVAVLSYDFSPRFNLSANWIFNSGQPVTYPLGKFSYGNILVPVYSGERNAYRYPDYHRLDLSATIKGKQKPNVPWRSEWNISLYNAYGRKNTWAILFVEDKENPGTIKTQMLYLFSVVPSITYNFYF